MPGRLGLPHASPAGPPPTNKIIRVCRDYFTNPKSPPQIAPDVEVEQRPQFLYANISPKLRIKGKGFGKDASGVHPVFVPPLEKNGKRFYNLTVTDSVISIGLKKGMRWPTSTTGESSTLFLQSLVVDQHGSSNQLKNAVPVATIIEPPSVVRG